MAELSDAIALPTPETDDLGRYLEDTITIDWQTPSVSECARRLLAEADEGVGGWVGAAGSPRSPGPAEEVGPQPQEGGPAPARSQPQDRTQARIERLFRFVRDEIAHTFDLDSAALETRAAATVAGFPPDFVRRGIACRASEVLALGHGLCFAKSHLLAALLRFAGQPTGFCHVRLVDDERPGRFVLHGFVACFVPSRQRWILLDPRGNRSDRDRPGERDAIESECRFEAPFSLAFVPDPARGESLLPLISKRPGKRIVDLLERVPDLAALRRTLPDRLD